MRIPAGAAAICGTPIVAGLLAFTIGTKPPSHACLGSGGVGTPAQTASVIILLEDLESQSNNTVLLDAARKVTRRLSPNDLIAFGVGDEDSANPPRLGVPLQPVGSRSAVEAALETEVQHIGDPISYDPAFGAAAAALAGQTGVKEVILIGDGDAESPDPATIAQLRREGATASTVWENPGGEVPTEMQQIAKEGGGSFTNAGDASNAPGALVHAVC